MKFEYWHAFVLMAVLSWGVYVPVLHQGQTMIGEGNPKVGSIRAFLCVGMAYFLTAVIIPAILLYFNWAGGEKFEFTRNGVLNRDGILYATLGGIAGAAGALGIILSIKNGGLPLYIAPLVFAGAPIVNVLVSMAWHPPKVAPGPLFVAGILLAAVGAGLVLYSKADADNRSRQAAAAPNSAETLPLTHAH